MFSEEKRQLVHILLLFLAFLLIHFALAGRSFAFGAFNHDFDFCAANEISRLLLSSTGE